LGFDALATGHHARIDTEPGPRWRLLRGSDGAKDQSYVLSMLNGPQLSQLVLPVGSMTKAQVRSLAHHLRLRTAAKPDSQDVCFIHSATGRSGFLRDRMPLHDGDLVDAATGAIVGAVDEIELVTVGQRRGLGFGPGGHRRFALSVDVPGRRIVVGDARAAEVNGVWLESLTWIDRPLDAGDRMLCQTSAHGPAIPATFEPTTFERPAALFDQPQRLVAPGQTVAFYDRHRSEAVVGAGIACTGPALDPCTHSS
jgi:tRNA-specific 2-thiouridylase